MIDKRRIQWQRMDGETVRQDQTAVTPQSHVLTIRLPYFNLVWNRPTAVLVEENGEERRLPIVDVTRTAQWALYGSTALVVLILWLLNRTAFSGRQ